MIAEINLNKRFQTTAFNRSNFIFVLNYSNKKVSNPLSRQVNNTRKKNSNYAVFYSNI